MRAENRKRLLRFMAAAAILTAMASQMAAVAGLPGEMFLSEGTTFSLPVSTALTPKMDGEGDDVAVIEREADAGGARLKAVGSGETQLTYSLLGIIPVRTVGVSVEAGRRLMPGGQSVGIAIDAKGVIVVGASDLGGTPSPARLAGLRAGDIIVRVDGAAVNSAKALSDKVCSGETLRVEAVREGRVVSCEITPAMDGRDGCWRLGAWVRDSTAGIGTLTFADMETGHYGALGHAITDADTSVEMPVANGALYANNVVDVTPSAEGSPGMLTGDFVFDAQEIGSVSANGERGIFGALDAPFVNPIYPDGVPAARRSEIHTGPATLLTTVDGTGVHEYACEIVKINDRANADTRALVIRVTDEELLSRTGGIVQGMSGSPIIQDGKLVGAVTHVMVNTPDMGYGICVDSMLETLDAIEEGTEGGKMAA